jgi:hypothetical protein
VVPRSFQSTAVMGVLEGVGVMEAVDVKESGTTLGAWDAVVFQSGTEDVIVRW